MDAYWVAGCVLAGYWLGSVPFAYLIGRAHGVDIRRVGSGNVGATNVGRTLGWGWGVLTFVLDTAKGWVAAVGSPWVGERMAAAASPPWLGLLCGAAAVAGHIWPIWLRFRGGKGVATCAGVLLGVAPAAAVVGVATWAVVFAMRRIISLASLAAALAVPLAAWVVYARVDVWRPWALTVLGALVVWRHRSNIRRLLEGTEPAIGVKRAGEGGQ
ncbi:MAG: glycerol-3-phosphate 1-O-acyltransferase PlsY [Kiritimatiellae bacterium]|nr:glycerol-3-phosphate 1-O-acyltransferase PlsY [Kiritimatiellia bacterium]